MNAGFSYPGVESSMSNLLYEFCALSGCLACKTYYHILSVGSIDKKQTDETASPTPQEREPTMKWGNAVTFWMFLTGDVSGMQKRLLNIHQRPENQEPHSTMSKRFIELEILLCSSI